MPDTSPTLHILCGKIASGKSTMAANLASTKGTVVIVEDTWLNGLFAEELKTPRDYMRCTTKLRATIAPHIRHLLAEGISVVLDFSANTVDQRAWLKTLIDEAGVPHKLHFLDAPDAVCLARLSARNAMGEHPFAVTEDQFHQFTRYFVPPSPDEGFDVVVHPQSE